MFSNNSQTSPLTAEIIVDIDAPSSNGGNNHQRCTSEFSKLFHDVFHRSTKHQGLQTDKEMTTLSKTLIRSEEKSERSASITNNTHQEELCLFSDSPHYVVRVRLRYRQ
jgi:hypothetical protein